MSGARESGPGGEGRPEPGRRGPGRPRASEAQPTRDRLLVAAEASFASSGFSKTTMEDIAVGAGITVGSLYHHFASKKDLFEAVLSRQADDLLGVLTAAVDQVESFGPRLVSLLEAARRLHTSRARAVFVAILPAQTVENPELAPLARRHGTGFRRLYERMVDDAVARGELPTALGREEVVGMLASFVSGLGSASAANPDPSAFGGIIDAYRALIDGLFAGSGPGSILVDGRKSNPT